MSFSAYSPIAFLASFARDFGTQAETWTRPASCFRSRYRFARSRVACFVFRAYSINAFSSSFITSLHRLFCRQLLLRNNVTCFQVEHNQSVTRHVTEILCVLTTQILGRIRAPKFVPFAPAGLVSPSRIRVLFLPLQAFGLGLRPHDADASRFPLVYPEKKP